MAYGSRYARFAHVVDTEILSESERSRVFRGTVSDGSLAGTPCVYKELCGPTAFLRHHDALLARLEAAQARADGSWVGTISSLPRVYSHSFVTLPGGLELLCASFSWIEGVSLASLLPEGGALCHVAQREGMAVAVSLAAAIARAAYSASKAIPGAHFVHQDLKPSNIILKPYHYPQRMRRGKPAYAAKDAADDWSASFKTGAWICSFVDLDLAYVEEPGVRLPYRPAPTGTPGYVAPECLTMDADMLTIDGAASDVFSLGVVVHEVLTGELPFHAGSHPLAGATSEEWRSFFAQAPSPISISAELPRAVADVLERCLMLDLALRPSVLEVARSLTAIAQRIAVEATPA